MSSPTFQEFLALDPEAGYEFVERSDEHARAVREGLGEQAFAEYLATRGAGSGGDHLAVTPETTVLFLPGIMGSSLESESLGGTWWLDLTNTGRINQLGLSRDGTTDANPKDDIRPGTTDHRYGRFLQYSRDESGFVHDKLAYDWRKSLRHSADAFRDRVREIHEANGGQPVHIAAHSMGGVLTRVGLMVHGDELWPMIGKIAFIGTPHYGSPAIGGYLKHHFWGLSLMVALNALLDRETFRTMRGALGLLPAPRGVYPDTHGGEEHPCANFDLYKAEEWHLDLDADATERLQEVLDDAAGLHRDLYAAHEALPQEHRDRMLVIAGVGIKTLFRLEYKRQLGFLWKHMDKDFDQDASTPHRLGDGRVPLASAALEHVGEIRYVRGVHGGLPNLEPVCTDVFNWFRGDPLQLPATPAGALAGDLSAGVAESPTPALDGTATLRDDDPGYLELEEPTPEETAALAQEIAEGRRPEFRSISLL